MKFSLVLVMASLAVVSATPIEQRAIAQEFDVSGFSAACIPHGTLCTFSFNVTTNEMPDQTKCNTSVNTAYTLPDVPLTYCVDPSISWSFSAIESGDNYTLILVDAEQGLAAAKVWDQAVFPVLDAGSTVYQQYMGAPDFIVA